MREVDGLDHLQHEADAIRHVQPGVLGVVRQGRAFDELHHEVGPAAVRYAAVQERRDARMLEPGEDLPFLPEAPRRLVVQPFRVHELEGDLPLVGAVRPLGAVDAAHAAAADQLEQAVPPDPRAGIERGRRLRRRRVRLEQRQRHVLQGPIDQRLGRVVRREKALHGGPELAIPIARFVQEPCALVRRALARLVEQRLHAGPALRVEGRRMRLSHRALLPP